MIKTFVYTAAKLDKKAISRYQIQSVVPAVFRLPPRRAATARQTKVFISLMFCTPRGRGARNAAVRAFLRQAIAGIATRSHGAGESGAKRSAISSPLDRASSRYITILGRACSGAEEPPTPDTGGTRQLYIISRRGDRLMHPLGNNTRRPALSFLKTRHAMTHFHYVKIKQRSDSNRHTADDT